MNISIVLSTYNGEKYLFEQLESLRNQTLLADEVLICDDCSTDNTVSMIDEYITMHNLNTWKLRVNPKNLGWQKNFMDLMCQANGDLIFPCDQDDIWDVQKLQIMHDCMNKYADIDLLCSDFSLLYMKDSIQKPKRKISRLKNDGSLERIRAHKALWSPDRPGCTYCIRKNLILEMRSLWFEMCPHDAIAWKLAVLVNSLAIIHMPLIQFRRHTSNASSGGVKTYEPRLEQMRLLAATFDVLLRYIDNNKRTTKAKIYCLKKYRLLQQWRLHALQKKSILLWAKCVALLVCFPSLHTWVGDGWVIFKARG